MEWDGVDAYVRCVSIVGCISLERGTVDDE